ncbi:PQQ-dependent sugar dehydrogenase [Actinopolymorpha alba]|uniref:PQQ-dependent sugar dehydrogenase n=1 Tax=Actinopolymorpha alba TaxID=533267 RepID=UPI000362B324|nr:PQQ-dependent sugar dehydrogenase [Actinopolymorpha alba]
MRRSTVLAAAVASLGLLGSCTSDPAPTGTRTPPPESQTTAATPRASSSPSRGGSSPTAGTPRVTGTVTEDLAAPWGLTFLPSGDALVAERDTGQIKRVSRDGTASRVGRVPGVRARGERGLLGLAVAPTFTSRPFVYAYFTAEADNRIVRMRYDGTTLGRPEVILSGIPAGFVHNGGRMVFGPDGQLYVGTGDASNGDDAQNPNSLGGKILRLTPDGAPAPGNPRPGSPVWSQGHRNVQGLAFDEAGRLWATEFGQDTWDELNLIRKGGNYGWPEAEGTAEERRFVDPVAVWRPEDASPSGLAYADGALWMASLHGQRLWRIQVPASREPSARDMGEPAAHFVREFGRLRTIAAAPDGTLWLTTSNTDGRGDPHPGDDRILRLELS